MQRRGDRHLGLCHGLERARSLFLAIAGAHVPHNMGVVNILTLDRGRCCQAPLLLAVSAAAAAARGAGNVVLAATGLRRTET